MEALELDLLGHSLLLFLIRFSLYRTIFSFVDSGGPLWENTYLWGVLNSILIFALVNVLAKGGSWEMGLTLALTLVTLLIFFQISVIVFWFTSIRGRHQP